MIAAAMLLALWPVSTADFTTWDDHQTIARNWALNPPSARGLAHHWQHPHMDLYVPLTYTVWWATAQVAHTSVPDAAGIRLNPNLFHTLNLLLHVGSALVVFRLLLLLLKRPWPAAAGALLFALHPVQVESVAWTSGTKDLLCGLFSLVALWRYTKFATAADGERRKRVDYALATAALILALLSKPTAMVVPVLVGVLDWGLLGRPMRRVVAALLPWALIVLPFMIVAKMVQPAHVVDAPVWWLRPLVAGDALSFYLYKLLLPVELCIHYGRTPAKVLANPWVHVAWIVPVTLGAGLWLLRRRLPAVAVGAAVFVIALLPVLGLVRFDFQAYSTVSDHYLYLSMLGAALISAWTVSVVAARAGVIAVGAVLIVLGARSWIQTWYWKDTRTVFEQALRVNPASEVAYNSLAAYYIAAREPAEALVYADKALEIKPDYARGHTTRAAALAMQGRLAQATEAYRQALRHAPDDPRILGDLGGILAEQGRFEEAMAHCRRAIELDPQNAVARMNFGALLAQQGRLEDARRELEAAVRLDRSDVRAHANLGIVLMHLGRPREAAERLKMALEIDPNFPPARRALADVLRSQSPLPAPGR